MNDDNDKYRDVHRTLCWTCAHYYPLIYFRFLPFGKKKPTKNELRAGQLGQHSDWLWIGRSGDRIPVGARFSARVQTGPGVQPASCIMGTGSFPGMKSGRDVTLTPHTILVPWSRKSRAIPLLPLWAVRPVQSLSARTNVPLFYLL